MKITVKPKLREPENIDWAELPMGTVVRCEYGFNGNNCVAVVYRGFGRRSSGFAPQLLVLDSNLECEQAYGILEYDVFRVVEVLGIISEVIVE